MPQKAQPPIPLGARILIYVGFFAMPAIALLLYLANSQPPTTEPGATRRLIGFVDDDANVVNCDVAMALEDRLTNFDKLGGPQIVVATRRQLDRPIDDVANKLARTWKIGRVGANNGVLLLFDVHGRRARIEVGYGLEGELTDARSRLIIADAIDPAMRTGDFSTAAQAGVDAILNVLHPGPIPRPASTFQDRYGILYIWTSIFALVAFGFFQWLALLFPGVEIRIAKSRWVSWFATVRILRRDLGGGGGSGDSNSSSGSSGSVGGGGTSGGGGADG